MAAQHARRKRRTWRVGLVLLLFLAAVAGGVAAGFYLRDSDGDDDEPAGAARDIEGPSMDGTGYAYELPEGWRNITADALASDLPKGVDTVSGRGTSFETAGATIIIERFKVEATTSLADVRRSWELNLTEEQGLKATYVPSLDIDGEPALGRQIRRTLTRKDAILQVAYLVIHEGYGYSIGLNSEEGDSNAGAAFDDVVASWLWDQ